MDNDERDQDHNAYNFEVHGGGEDPVREPQSVDRELRGCQFDKHHGTEDEADLLHQGLEETHEFRFLEFFDTESIS